MYKIFLCFASVYGALAVILGAFGAHALKVRLEPDALSAWHTAVQYHFYHALALFAVGLLANTVASRALTISGIAMIMGTALFSGSLYLLATRSLLPFGSMRFLGPVTPLGGLTLIIGWVSLACAVFRLK